MQVHPHIYRLIMKNVQQETSHAVDPFPKSERLAPKKSQRQDFEAGGPGRAPEGPWSVPGPSRRPWGGPGPSRGPLGCFLDPFLKAPDGPRAVPGGALRSPGGRLEQPNSPEANSLEKPKVDLGISGPFGNPPTYFLIGRFSVDSILAEKTTPLEWFPPISFRFRFQKHQFSWMFPGLVH